MINLVEKLIPKKGFLWRILPGYFADLLFALNEEPKRIRDYLQYVVRESNPGTAIDTQEDWYQQYGLSFNETKSLAEKQAETLERYVALGDQDIVYLQEQVTKAGFLNVTLYENKPPVAPAGNVCGVARTGVARCWSAGSLGPYWIFYYWVIGTVDNKAEATRLDALLQKLAPGHLVPKISVIQSDNVCGVAVCGVATCDG